MYGRSANILKYYNFAMYTTKLLMKIRFRSLFWLNFVPAAAAILEGQVSRMKTLILIKRIKSKFWKGENA